jgi:F-type H+-transporting ATPase subunit a
LAQQRLLIWVLGLAGMLMLIGFVTGAVGAALMGRDEPLIAVPEVHLAPQAVFHIGSFTVTNTLLSAWLTTIVVVLLFVLGTRRMRLVPKGLQNLLEMFVEALYGFVTQVAGEHYGRRFFPLLATIFVFVAFNAWMALLPIYQAVGLKEGGSEQVTTHLLRSAGTDINMPLALALISLIFVEGWGFRAHGFGYLREFVRLGGFVRGVIHLNPGAIFYGFIDAAIGALEFVSHLIRLASFTFRLFGNMLAGEIILLMVTFLLTFTAAIAFYGLEILVGGVQALIFTGLTLVFAVMAVSRHDEGHEEAQAH